MKVLIACETSGISRRAFQALGHDVMSCDLLEADDGETEKHYVGDVRDILYDGWDLMIAHPTCFEAGTLIKTSKGLKNIEDVNINDYVLTHKNRYRKVYNIQTTVSENIMSIRTLSSQFKVTKEHPFYTIKRGDSSPEWVTANNLTKDHFIGMPILNEEKIEDIFQKEFIENLPLYDENFWWIVGKWIGDGWSLKHHYSYENYICSSYKECETSILEEKIISVFGRMSKEKTKTVIRYIIRNKYLFDFLNTFGKYCDNKYIPEEVFKLPANFTKALLNGYFFADGHINRDGRRQQYPTVSKKLSYGIQLLVCKVFKKVPSIIRTNPRNKKHFIDGRLIKQNVSYVSIFQYYCKSEKYENRFSFEKDGYLWVKVTKKEEIIWGDKVYNLSIDEDESYIANNLIVHNCTYLCNSGVCHLYKDVNRWPLMYEAAEFFKLLLNAPIEKICIENPIPHKYAIQAIGRKYDCITQPYLHGHMERKATCFWLKNLPKLQPTNNVKAEMLLLPKKDQQRMHYMSPGKDRWKARSKTYEGIGLALAQQYGGNLNGSM